MDCDSKHVAAFLHGLDAHSLMSMSQIPPTLGLLAATSPAATRVLRSLFRLDDDAETSLVGRDDACVSELSDDDKGRWDDDGENDRPWH